MYTKVRLPSKIGKSAQKTSAAKRRIMAKQGRQDFFERIIFMQMTILFSKNTV